MVRLKGEESKVSEQTSTPRLTGQFSKALVYAELKHHNQVRKGGDIPYIGHLLTAAGLVINDGGSEAQAIAALLHDTVEDAGGHATLEEIKKSATTTRMGHRSGSASTGRTHTTTSGTTANC
jgi:(p)ppGpp synthase/HD superfamily hydrolase